jgi:hypothetical protein
MSSLFSLKPTDLGRIDVTGSVEIFRDLLWCHARKHSVPITKIHITSRVTNSDGGVDAKIDDGISNLSSELLVSSGTGYQLKTGTSFKPWQSNKLSKELFGKTNVDINIDNLGSEIKRTLESGSKYVVVCFGLDPTSEQINDGKQKLIGYFQQCGFENPNVEIWGQTHLIGLISEFPSLVLKILGKAEYHFQTIKDWSKNDDMNHKAVLGETQSKRIKKIRELIRTTSDHLRVIGEPGVGKSRLILEVLSDKDIAPSVIYISHAEDFQKSQLFNDLVRTDKDYYVTLVVDECQDKERASIWNVLKAYRDKCQLISIDHGPENSTDEAMQVFDCPLLENKQIAEIINSYIDLPDESRRWAEWCSGSPRVAHVLGLNLTRNPEDLLRPPATLPIWERFIAGYEDPDSEINNQRLVVLRYIALFQRFGFEMSVSYEARFIAKLVEHVDPAITWGKFQSIVKGLLGKRILQGKTTLFIVPKALHAYLWLDYWKHYGRGFDFKEFIENLPESLLDWFTNMFKYAHADPLSQQVVKDILSQGGPYNEEVFLKSEIGTRFLSVLAEANPKETLKCLQRTFGTWDKEKLLLWTEHRQNIVWALEKITVWTDTFRGAAKLLLKLGVTENTNYSNNAGSTFSGLYSLLALTEAAPETRMPVLLEVLNSDDPDERSLGLKACETALSAHGGFRIIGAEHQGLKPEVKPWSPKKDDEIFDAYRSIWDKLYEISRPWPTPIRETANNVLISAANRLIYIQSLSDHVLNTLDALIDDEATMMSDVINFIVTTRMFRSDNLAEETKMRINRLDHKITGTSLEQKIKRYVLNSKNSDDERRVTELAERSIENIPDLLAQLEYLACTEGSMLYKFAYEIAQRDKDRILLQSIIDTQRAAASNGKTQFIGGYLRYLYTEVEDEWEKLIIFLLYDEDFRNIAGDLIWRSGVNNNVLIAMLDAYNKGILKPKDFNKLTILTNNLKSLDQALVEKVLTVLIDRNEEESLSIALDVSHLFFKDKNNPRQLPEELVYDLLTNPFFFTKHLDTMHEYQYHWKQLAELFINTYPERDLELFRLIMEKLENGQFIILKSTSIFHAITVKIAKAKPSETWNIIQSKLENLSMNIAHGILNWLREEDDFGEGPGIRPVTYFPYDEILAWIEEDPVNRAPAIARVCPSTLDMDDGKITREILVRYGDIENVKLSISHVFLNGGFSGLSSDYNRRKRDQARKWLEDEMSQIIIAWLEEFIDVLSNRIEKDEIYEERRFH